MSYQHMDADECRVCFGYSNAGFDICEECAKKEEKERIIKIIKSHIQPTYPINCKSIINEINDVSQEKAE